MPTENDQAAAALPSGSLRRAVQVLLALAAMAAALGFISFRRYVEESPRFCETCHHVAPEIAVWMESEHREVRCQQCHHPSLSDGLRVLSVYVGGEATAAGHAPVDVSSCAECHASHDPRWPSIANSVGHRVHTDVEALTCIGCHGAQMHFRQPARESCRRCHADQSVGSAHEEAHCLACHDFLSTLPIIKPRRRDCLRCHQRNARPIVLSPTAPMQFTCSGCHHPHRPDEPVACAQCHKPDDLAGLHNEPAHQPCSSCHAAHDWKSTRRHCLQCHSERYAHHPEADKRCSDCHGFEADLRAVEDPP